MSGYEPPEKNEVGRVRQVETGSRSRGSGKPGGRTLTQGLQRRSTATAPAPAQKPELPSSFRAAVTRETALAEGFDLKLRTEDNAVLAALEGREGLVLERGRCKLRVDKVLATSFDAWSPYRGMEIGEGELTVAASQTVDWEKLLAELRVCPVTATLVTRIIREGTGPDEVDPATGELRPARTQLDWYEVTLRGSEDAIARLAGELERAPGAALELNGVPLEYRSATGGKVVVRTPYPPVALVDGGLSIRAGAVDWDAAYRDARARFAALQAADDENKAALSMAEAADAVHALVGDGPMVLPPAAARSLLEALRTHKEAGTLRPFVEALRGRQLRVQTLLGQDQVLSLWIYLCERLSESQRGQVVAICASEEIGVPQTTGTLTPGLREVLDIEMDRDAGVIAEHLAEIQASKEQGRGGGDDRGPAKAIAAIFLRWRDRDAEMQLRGTLLADFLLRVRTENVIKEGLIADQWTNVLDECRRNIDGVDGLMIELVLQGSILSATKEGPRELPNLAEELATGVAATIADWACTGANAVFELLRFVAEHGPGALKLLATRLGDIDPMTLVEAILLGPAKLGVWVVEFCVNHLLPWLRDNYDVVLKLAAGLVLVAASAPFLPIIGVILAFVPEEPRAAFLRTLDEWIIAGLLEIAANIVVPVLRWILDGLLSTGTGFYLEADVAAVIPLVVPIMARGSGHFSLLRKSSDVLEMVVRGEASGAVYYGAGASVEMGTGKKGSGPSGAVAELGASAEAGLRGTVVQRYEFPIFSDSGMLSFAAALLGIEDAVRLGSVFSEKLSAINPAKYCTQLKHELKAYGEGHLAAGVTPQKEGKGEPGRTQTWSGTDEAPDLHKADQVSVLGTGLAAIKNPAELKKLTGNIRLKAALDAALEFGFGFEIAKGDGRDDEVWRTDPETHDRYLVKATAILYIEALATASCSIPGIPLPALNGTGGGVRLSWDLTLGEDGFVDATDDLKMSIYGTFGEGDVYQGAAGEAELQLAQGASLADLTELEKLKESLAGIKAKMRFAVGGPSGLRGRKYLARAEQRMLHMLPAHYQDEAVNVEGYLDTEFALDAEQGAKLVDEVVGLYDQASVGLVASELMSFLVGTGDLGGLRDAARPVLTRLQQNVAGAKLRAEIGIVYQSSGRPKGGGQRKGKGAASIGIGGGFIAELDVTEAIRHDMSFGDFLELLGDRLVAGEPVLAPVTAAEAGADQPSVEEPAEPSLAPQVHQPLD